jgi:hypothetical protein
MSKAASPQLQVDFWDLLVVLTNRWVLPCRFAEWSRVSGSRHGNKRCSRNEVAVAMTRHARLRQLRNEVHDLLMTAWRRLERQRRGVLRGGRQGGSGWAGLPKS